MRSLVGYTGFVGSNIYAYGKFDKVYNSKNIKEAYNTKPDLLIYSGMRAEKYLANTNPSADMDLVFEAERNIKNIAPKRLVLISTIDIFKNSVGKYEDSYVDTNNLHAYGYNRYCLEQWVRENYEDALIIRLPGLFGINIKKNFIYDYINIIPFMLNKNKFEELTEIDSELKNFYINQDNGFYKCRDLDEEQRSNLRLKFKELGFTALHFTDSRNVYQLYPLSRLSSDINIALENNLKIWHPATEPVSAGEIYEYISGDKFINIVSENPVYYDYRTRYADLFGGVDGYLMKKEEVLESVKKFVEEMKN